MYTDVPMLNRCCFCFPLRYGLLVTGCISLVLNLYHICDVSQSLNMLISQKIDDSLIEMKKFIIAVNACELAMRSLYVCVSIILIIAALKRHEKLFRFLFYYSLADMAFLLVFFIYITCMSIHFQASVLAMSTNIHLILRSALQNIMTFGGSLLIDAYTILLIRSELYKLRESSNKIQFTNRAAEAQVVVETL